MKINVLKGSINLENNLDLFNEFWGENDYNFILLIINFEV